MVEAQAGQALPSPEVQAEGLSLGLAARVGGAIRGAYESWQQHREERRVVGQIALAITGGVAGVEAANLILDAAPAGANDNVPALSAEAFTTEPATPWAIENHAYEGPGSATASSLQQKCKSAELAAPTIVGKIPGTPYYGTVMADAGKVTQSVGVTLETQPTPEECRSSFRRLGAGTVYLSTSKHRKQPAKMDKISGSPAVHYGGDQGGKRYGVVKQQAGDKHDDYKCGDSVWLELDSEMKSLRSHNIVGEKIRWSEIPVLNADGSNAAC